MEKDKMHLLFTADENYAVRIPTVLYSIKAAHPVQSAHIHLISDSCTEDAVSKLKACCDRLEFGFTYYQIDEDVFSDAPITKHYSSAMYYRLLASEILPDSMERILYLDPDILVINPLTELWEMDLCGYTFAAASHSMPESPVHDINHIRLNTTTHYYNTGVLLMDLTKCRRMIDQEDVFRYIEENQHVLILPDQDVFNALYGIYTLEVPDEIWNYDTRKYSQYLVESGGILTVDEVIKRTSILHFCGKNKPWNKGCTKLSILYKHYENLARVYGNTTTSKKN